jgi:hypothetical protein
VFKVGGDLVAEACRRAGSGLTETEQREFLLGRESSRACP